MDLRNDLQILGGPPPGKIIAVYLGFSCDRTGGKSAGRDHQHTQL
jgi:hypothetical protein